MKVKNSLITYLKKNVLVLDGAMGTELQKYGLISGICPEAWCIIHPQKVALVHRQYKDAGAKIIYSSTFGANRVKLAEYKIKNIHDVNERIVSLAKQAAGKSAYVAGDIGPTGHFVKPFGSLVFEEAVDDYKEQVKGLLDGGADLFVIETMMDIQEARAALLAVKELTDKFVMVTLTFEKDGRTLHGTDPVTALVTLQSLGADAVGCNCSAGPAEMIALIESMKPYAAVPLIAKPNAGMPRLHEGKTIFDMQPSMFADMGAKLVKAGANIIGGCCGTTPLHIEALRKRVQKMKPAAPLSSQKAAVSSARKVVFIDGQKPMLVVGERINPTGKKDLQQELMSKEFSLVRAMAKQQEQEGAAILDVNVGVAGINEEKTIKQVVELLSTTSELPLCIDSSHVKTIETALRIYPGRGLINSISAEPVQYKKLFALAKKYGAMCILLPVTKEGVPETALERISVIKSLVKEAKKAGIAQDDVIVDGITLSVSAQQSAGEETLKTLRWCTDVLKVKTVLGLSNVSFGLPQRKWINAAFLAMAQSNGLTMAIINPAGEELKHTRLAADVLTGRDKSAAAFILTHSHILPQTKNTAQSHVPVSARNALSLAIIEGNSEVVPRYLKQLSAEKAKAIDLVNTVIIPAIQAVGERFEKKEYFLPQLIASAEAAKCAFQYLKPYLKESSNRSKRKALIVLATVKGDIHDIGKNIVSLMLENHGFRVIDLGKDVSAERIVSTAKRYKADIIGLSALMTTTMVNMQQVIKLAKQEGLMSKFMVGGAAVTEHFAQTIGASFGKNGVEAVKVVEKLST